MELEIMCGGKDVCVLLLLLLSLYRVVQARASEADPAFIPRLISSPCVYFLSLRAHGTWPCLELRGQEDGLDHVTWLGHGNCAGGPAPLAS